jgi:hypothetical protein
MPAGPSENDGALVSDASLTALEPVSDAELTALALASDPAVALDPDAIPFDVYLGRTAGSLPSWYMPPARSRATRRGRRAIVLGIVGLLLLIEALGLCTTYGPPLFPFR